MIEMMDKNLRDKINYDEFKNETFENRVNYYELKRIKKSNRMKNKDCHGVV